MRISEHLSLDHCRCDALLATLEQSVQSGDWPRITSDLAKFIDAMESHFDIEESAVFPALTSANPMWTSPTEVMKREHAEMRDMLKDLAKAVDEENTASASAVTETLLFTVQIHNAKEENVLYRMIDEAIGPESESLSKKIEEWADGAST